MRDNSGGAIDNSWRWPWLSLPPARSAPSGSLRSRSMKSWALSSRRHPLVSRAWSAKADIVHYRVAEQNGLAYDTDLAALVGVTCLMSLSMAATFRRARSAAG